jgi:hypothetical protein
MNRCRPPREKTISLPATQRTMKGKDDTRLFFCRLIWVHTRPSPCYTGSIERQREVKRGKPSVVAVSADGTGPKKDDIKKLGGGLFIFSLPQY